MLTYILCSLVGIILLLFVLAFFVPRAYRIERQILIGRPVEDVFSYIRLLKNQDNYSKWVMADPAKRTTFRGTDGTVGFVYGWDSDLKEVGKGEQEIVSIDENNVINMEVRFEKPFRNTAQVSMVTTALEINKTVLSWIMNGESKYPMNLMTLFMKSLLGKDMDTSLSTLKARLEK